MINGVCQKAEWEVWWCFDYIIIQSLPYLKRLFELLYTLECFIAWNSLYKKIFFCGFWNNDPHFSRNVHDCRNCRGSSLLEQNHLFYLSKIRCNFHLKQWVEYFTDNCWCTIFILFLCRIVSNTNIDEKMH